MVTLDERVGRLEGKMESLATKEDLATLRADMTDQMAGLRTDMTDQMATLRADMMEQMASLRTDMTEQLGQQRTEIMEMQARILGMESRMLKWTMSTVLAGMALAVTIGVAF